MKKLAAFLCLSFAVLWVGVAKAQDIEFSHDPNFNQLLNAVVVYSAVGQVCEDDKAHELFILVERVFRRAHDLGTLTPVGTMFSTDLALGIKSISSMVTTDSLGMTCSDAAKQTPIIQKAVNNVLDGSVELGLGPSPKLNEGTNHAETPEDILSKSDADQMFAMSYEQWKQNITSIKTFGMGDYTCLENNCTMLVRTPGGLLSVKAVYGDDETKPKRVIVTSIYDVPALRKFTESWDDAMVESLISKARNELSPDYTVVGYLFRNFKDDPQVIMSISQRGVFPLLDEMSNENIFCPYDTISGQQDCVKEELIE